MFSNLTSKITAFINSLATALDKFVASIKDAWDKLK